ncbi:GNAT family N-acetyltransferase [Absiella sp. AM09-50]|uniref:GNAT family N-acetyltransferase n=1 Tax=[Eubacterium] hominis TaxID=2764325 RepID=A0A7G9GN23_9FIRM|nr:GNAT family N-acetyltransferase [[Eubacterium] hominis]RGB57311.1 GNAT family N-acetyltransferase [Absiella sp. AM22-9]RGB59588.1 GNAT family N-acetyltransferase [Absiella sp. AM10-20]RGB66437.1 GNAT family N-acetyltransferase [Absiella sp. AM09-45]RGB75460.1 GNAT family N-acetyltransferase [Absiella sp. AM09-50]RHU02466.1 GNAT family N-acetyltransferase [Absiella sp. AM27-20]
MKIVNGIDYIEQVKIKIIEYTTRLGRDLSFQNIDEELSNPAIKYAAPQGELLVALDDHEKVIGMVAYHKHSDERCEMKRLYVSPECRGMKLGEKLVDEIIQHAKNAGFKEMVLDTIVPLQAAIHLYNKMGFEECEPYYYNPMDDVIYMKRLL